MNYDITFIVPTYNRPDIIQRTVQGLRGHIIYTLGNVTILIGNDGDQDIRFDSTVRVIEGPRSGLGANLNKLMRVADTDLIFQMDDDHVLVDDIDLDAHARFLMQDPVGRNGWVRLMFGHSSERNRWPQDYYHFRATLYKEYWRVEPGNELWVPSNRPHLKHRNFHRYYGAYSEDETLGGTEREFCSRWQQKARSGPGVFIPFNPPHEDVWQHVGESWQHTEHDKVKR